MWKTINAAVVVGLNSTVILNVELTGIGIVAAGTTRLSSELTVNIEGE
jgi:hypothetical protein